MCHSLIFRKLNGLRKRKNLPNYGNLQLPMMRRIFRFSNIILLARIILLGGIYNSGPYRLKSYFIYLEIFNPFRQKPGVLFFICTATIMLNKKCGVTTFTDCAKSLFRVLSIQSNVRKSGKGFASWGNGLTVAEERSLSSRLILNQGRKFIPEAQRIVHYLNMKTWNEPNSGLKSSCFISIH